MIFWRKIDLLWVSVSLDAWHLSLGKRLHELGILFGGDCGGLRGIPGLGPLWGCRSVGKGKPRFTKTFTEQLYF